MAAELDVELDAFFAKTEKRKKTEGKSFVTTEETAKAVDATQSEAEDKPSGAEKTASEAGKSTVAERINKLLSFITFLEDSDEIVFECYKGIHPRSWKLKKNGDLYFLKGVRQETSVKPRLEELHNCLQNYQRLRESLHKAMEACLRSGPVYLKLEARFGKVLWGSDGENSVSDEVLKGRYRRKDLERSGKLSVEDVLGGRAFKWDFQTLLLDTTIPECVKAKFPEIGNAYRIDITIGKVLEDEEYLIRIKQNRENFEISEVHLKGEKSYIFDCLVLERELDMRIAMSCSLPNDKPEAVIQTRKIAQDLCLGMAERDGCLYVNEPPGWSIKYARRAKQTMYLVSHQDEVHGECPYILAHYQVQDCQDHEMSSSAVECTELKLQFTNEHHEVELWNCQWMTDFAGGKTPEEAFTLQCCNSSKIKVRPKYKSEVNADSVIRELNPFVDCALQLALIDRD